MKKTTKKTAAKKLTKKSAVKKPVAKKSVVKKFLKPAKKAAAKKHAAKKFAAKKFAAKHGSGRVPSPFQVALDLLNFYGHQATQNWHNLQAIEEENGKKYKAPKHKRH